MPQLAVAETGNNRQEIIQDKLALNEKAEASLLNEENKITTNNDSENNVASASDKFSVEEKILGVSTEEKNNSPNLLGQTESKTSEDKGSIRRFFENIGTGINSFINRITLKFF